MSHAMGMSYSEPSGYQCFAFFGGNNKVSPTEDHPFMMANIDASGNLNANILAAPSERTRCKVIAQILESRRQSAQVITYY